MRVVPAGAGASERVAPDGARGFEQRRGGAELNRECIRPGRQNGSVRERGESRGQIVTCRLVAHHHHVAETRALRSVTSRKRLAAIDELHPTPRNGRGRNRRPRVAGERWMRQAGRLHQAQGARRVPGRGSIVGGHDENPAIGARSRVNRPQHVAIVRRQRTRDIAGLIGAPKERDAGDGVDAEREADISGQQRGSERSGRPPPGRRAAQQVRDHKARPKRLRRNQDADDAIRLTEDPQAGHGVDRRLIGIRG